MVRRPILILLCFILAVALSAWQRASAQEPHVPAAGGAHPAATTAQGGHAPAREGSESPLKAEPALAIWTLAVFVGLLLLLGRFAWKPLLTALHNREHHLEHVLLETERARNESESLLGEHRKQMARAAEEVRGILDEARQQAQAAADQLIKVAQGEADSARQRAQREIAAARDEALSEIWQKSADLAVAVAGKVLSQQLSEQDHRRLLDAAIRELPSVAANPADGRRSA
jgi:F-type H+-transporting ATPase subunit b